MSASWKQRLRGAANGVLHPLGLHLDRKERVFDMGGLIARAAARHPAIRTWIDVGASDGKWSLEAHRHFPRAEFLLFEPLEERRAALTALHRRHGFHIAHAVAGASAGEISFSIDPGLDGSGVATPGDASARTVPLESVDGVVTTKKLGGPYGLKLDTHGFELPVLEGAAQVLASTELLVIEAYNFQITPGCLRFHELCAWLEARGFRCSDLADPMRRPRDGALWQVDLAFARADNLLFRATSYS